MKMQLVSAELCAFKNGNPGHVMSSIVMQGPDLIPVCDIPVYQGMNGFESVINVKLVSEYDTTRENELERMSRKFRTDDLKTVYGDASSRIPSQLRNVDFPDGTSVDLEMPEPETSFEVEETGGDALDDALRENQELKDQLLALQAGNINTSSLEPTDPPMTAEEQKADLRQKIADAGGVLEPGNWGIPKLEEMLEAALAASQGA